LAGTQICRREAAKVVQISYSGFTLGGPSFKNHSFLWAILKIKKGYLTLDQIYDLMQ
jgi:hypothetical protein